MGNRQRFGRPLDARGLRSTFTIRGEIIETNILDSSVCLSSDYYSFVRFRLSPPDDRMILYRRVTSLAVAGRPCPVGRFGLWRRRADASESENAEATPDV